MLLLTMAAAAALQLPAPSARPQSLDPLNCSAAGNYVTNERLRFAGATFRFSGRITAGQRRADDFAPRAMISLLQEERPAEELSAVLSVQPASPGALLCDHAPADQRRASRAEHRRPGADRGKRFPSWSR